MTNKINAKKIAFCGATIIIVLGLGLYTNMIKLPITGSISIIDYTSDVASYEGVIKASDNVFVGKVKKQVGTKSTYADSPDTQFAVEVIDNLKGELRGTVVVSQAGGYRYGMINRIADGIKCAPDDPTGEDNNGLMREGETYLFVTSYGKKEDSYFAHSFPHSTKLLSRDKNMSVTALKSLYGNDERFTNLQEAYRNVSADENNKNDPAYNDAKWTVIKQSIDNCDVTMVEQKQDMTVNVLLRNGHGLTATEPQTDSITILAHAAESKCGKIMIE